MVKSIVDAVDIDPKTGTTLGFYSFGEERPNLLIIAAMDGGSATDVYASYLILKHLEGLDRIYGSVTILPVANPLAFRLGAKVSPLDSKDLDSVFPGDEHGTVTERTAWEIWRRASQADYIIHLRTGWQNCISHIVAMHREYIHVRNLASQIALPNAVQCSGQRGSLLTEAAHEGIPVVSIEMRGDIDQVDSQAAVEVREAILNFMRLKDMISGERIETSVTLSGRMQHINIDTEGFFIPQVNLGENIQSGGIIGTIQDKIEIVTPFDGVIVSLSRMNYVFEGDIIARVAPPLGDNRSRIETQEEEPVPKRRKW
ncbi:MAG: succinylglutamate desuccinylase/aspartoacylase family protein [Candidatus Thorarchaeota archaeon]|nr:succinylglutamate desuccinylase/aspartoacylase family protein [Candidatus Thorarchaeota archaeon]